ncbi:hypothetical protein D0Z07_1154 [Hyphodiscus hymeniophilus]|uniref:F-box domain-containing protein n=1 Tax=Hyphodiscus hymeniophilus TaxID=353542 RepID=A0A9P6VQW7_9HELO|nr:hypothetical protein D0Z07_1154 [Hyphodiscus hymeniophilus]
MVLFVDLEDEIEPPEIVTDHWQNSHRRGFSAVKIAASDDGRVNPNKNATTEALGCYPIIMSIASHIDLNTLDALSLTCRQVRANLLQSRSQLLASTLHCENEHVELDPEHTFRYRARAADWYFVDAGRDAAGVGKVGDCARDMNCTIKPPAPILLRHRHRRICTTCQRAPLSCLINPHPCADIHPSSNPRIAIAGEMLKRAICTCVSEGVWLCQPCGRSLRSADTEYESIWRWRTRYLPSLGGLGVGIGEGNRGVPCGRAGACIAAREVEQETDCDAEDARDIDSSSRGMGPGYARHEVEGIGGVMKKLVVKMVKVGACVPEFGDEKEMGKSLIREVDAIWGLTAG